MKTTRLCSLLIAGTLALFTVSCREENRNDNDRYSNERNDGYQDEWGDGRVGEDEWGDGRVGKDRLGDGKIGKGDDRYDYREVRYQSSISAGREMIVGADRNKVWKARSDLNQTGSDELFEREGEFRFLSNGTFTLKDDEYASRSGMWSYDGSRLSLKYSGQATIYSYTVSDLTNNRMELVASDGSELVFVDKDFR